MAIFRVPVPLLFFAALSFAQMQPQSAHVNLFFPHLADGGPANQRWQTTFTFVNTGFTDATVTLDLFADNGSPLSLDFGSGAVSEQQFTIKAGGTTILRSQSASDNIVVGWAAAMSNVPVMGTVAFRYFVNGVPQQEMSAQPTLPTIRYYSAANPLLGVALANVNPQYPANVAIDLFDSNGQYWGNQATMRVPPGGHQAFTLTGLAQQIGKALDGFSGSVMMSAVDPRYDEFLAWTVASDNQGIFSTLPPGPTAFPISHWDRIELVFWQMYDAANALGILTSPPDLSIITDQTVNAFAQNGKTVSVSLGLSQLISDSPGELAFVVAHDLAHIYQQQSGQFNMNRNDPENDADLWATVIMLEAGYDPYSISGALAKIQLAIAAGMTNGFDNLANAAALQSVKARQDAAFNTLQTACKVSTQVTQQCDYYKSVIHPNLPGDWQVAPLSVRPRPALSTSGAGVRSPTPLRSRPVAR